MFSECICNTTGAVSAKCNSEGFCDCKTDDIIGDNCSDCKKGLVGFPNCRGIFLAI